jgi:hypothetical protein
VLASRKFADQCRPARIWAVLPRATTSPKERVQTLANAARVWGVKLLQRRQNREAAANACERRCRLDKLGVTGSRPGPRIREKVRKAGLFSFFEFRREPAWGRNVSFGTGFGAVDSEGRPELAKELRRLDKEHGSPQ